MGGGGGVYTPSTSQMNAANSSFGNLTGQAASALNGYPQQVTNQAQDITQAFMANPYAGVQQQGANTSALYGINSLAPSQAGSGTTLTGLGNTYAPAAAGQISQLYNPQNTLYNYDLGQTLDQQNAINAMNGLGGSPYGAGLTGQAAQTFNMNWQDQLANLQSLAAQTGANLTNTATGAYNAGSNLGGAALNTLTTASGLPYSTYAGQLTGDLSALTGQNTAVAGAIDPTLNTANTNLNYLQYGSGADAQNAQLQDSFLGGIGGLFGNLLGLGTGTNNSTLGGDFITSLGIL